MEKYFVPETKTGATTIFQIANPTEWRMKFRFSVNNLFFYELIVLSFVLLKQ